MHAYIGTEPISDHPWLKQLFIASSCKSTACQSHAQDIPWTPIHRRQPGGLTLSPNSTYTICCGFAVDLLWTCCGCAVHQGRKI